MQGPAVRGFRIERSSGAARVIVTLGGDLRNATEIRFLAHARVPDLGRWLIPAIRPRNATWTGGTTTVILDSRHVVAECVERAGRRLFGPLEQESSLRRLSFQAVAPRPVAELVFAKPATEASCLLRGQLFVSGSPCRLECQLDWTASAALDPEVEIDLSPGWTAERVVMRGSSEPLQSHATVLPTGITRLQVVIPASALPGKELSFLIMRQRDRDALAGPLDLPRVSVGGSTWRMTRGWRGPIKGRSSGPWRRAAWPGSIRARSPACCLRARFQTCARCWAGAGLTRAAARVSREPIESEPGASIVMSATVDPLQKRLRLDGRVTIFAGALPIESVPIWVERPMGSPDALVFDDSGRASRGAPGRVEAAALGLPEGGYALVLPAKIAGQSQQTFSFHAEYPWTSGLPIPMIAVSRKFRQQGLIVVKTPLVVRSRFQATGLRALDASRARARTAWPARSRGITGRYSARG